MHMRADIALEEVKRASTLNLVRILLVVQC